MIIDHIAARAHDGSSSRESETYIFAPSLRTLPQGFPLVMATLPVTDWNAELFQALRDATSVQGKRYYAAMMMIDPFTLWEDLADLLKEKGFIGVVNFPPASLAEGTQTAGSAEAANTIEIDRLKWYHETGLRLVYTASSTQEIASVQNRLADLLDGIIYFPPDTLAHPVGSRMELEAFHVPGLSSSSVWSLKTTP
ncbi:hypothetical protein [Phyllobacterium chamaecytisi]|uniref:hypothetical protein n=1 Tax=Phyllobacterium chamaecytisi TaxID=2876082 RepID=UPI001CCEFA12|nr:hypothetical protein [Phyllobacterium sp. KW56]MBZ9605542.1 hypothetical protein [Phyllobacterium sp. KW56]